MFRPSINKKYLPKDKKIEDLTFDELTEIENNLKEIIKKETTIETQRRAEEIEYFGRHPSAPLTVHQVTEAESALHLVQSMLNTLKAKHPSSSEKSPRPLLKKVLQNQNNLRSNATLEKYLPPNKKVEDLNIDELRQIKNQLDQVIKKEDAINIQRREEEIEFFGVSPHLSLKRPVTEATIALDLVETRLHLLAGNNITHCFLAKEPARPLFQDVFHNNRNLPPENFILERYLPRNKAALEDLTVEELQDIENRLQGILSRDAVLTEIYHTAEFAAMNLDMKDVHTREMRAALQAVQSRCQLLTNEKAHFSRK